MPIKRPNLHLNLLPRQTLTSTQEHLYSNFDSLKAQMRGDPAPHFREYSHAPDYSAMRQSRFATLHNGFMVNNSGLDAFMHARREQGQCAGAFAGDKLHISVKREDVPLAFNALSGLLFSEDCPIDKWKVTDMERVEPGGRVSGGAQFTLYVKPDAADSRYTAQGLNSIRHFVERLESVMTEHNIQPGQHPDSDVRPFHWQFTSYRNEMRSEREGGEEQSLALRNEPFYRLVTE